MGAKLAIQEAPSRKLEDLITIENPVYTILKTKLYVRTNNYLKIVELDKISEIVAQTDYYSPRCIIYVEDATRCNGNCIILDFDSTFTCQEKKMLAREITKNIIDLYERHLDTTD